MRTDTIAAKEAAKAAQVVIPFGVHKGKTLGEAPNSYVEWLAGDYAHGAPPNRPTMIGDFKVPARISRAAALVANEAFNVAHDAIRAKVDEAYKTIQGHVLPQATTYVAEYKGAILDYRLKHSNPTAWLHASLDEALAWIAESFEGPERHSDLQPEDRILVWEVLPTGHKKVVWHASGERYDRAAQPIPQGALPGHETSLRREAELRSAATH